MPQSKLNDEDIAKFNTNDPVDTALLPASKVFVKPPRA